MPITLYDQLLKLESPPSDLLLEKFLDYVTSRGLDLYPAQEEAILEIFEGKNVILNSPTGSGKSLVAAALHFHALAKGRRSVYTCPIKALVNEKWLALCRDFGPDNVGLSTGDATINREAPILCCTAEVLANISLRQGPEAAVHEVVIDEFHYYSDRDRGTAWQVPLLTLSQARFLLMSATLGETEFFEKELTSLTKRPSVTVQSQDRPVPLEFTYSELVLAQTLENLVQEGKAPIYVVHFTQLEAAQSAQDFMSINVATREEKHALAKALEPYRFNSPYGPEIKRWLKHGIGLHHAGLLPRYRVLVEQLAQQGLLKLICGTDTLGVGINVPIRTVLLTRLCKYDGQKTSILSARDFHQITGRAGRKGYDDRGWVVVQAPEHFIENQQLQLKAERTGKKFVKRKPPEKNFVNWDKNTFNRLLTAPPEPLISRFEVSHGMLLNVLSRLGDSCRAMRTLIDRSHESPRAKKDHRKRAWQLFRSLLNQGIIELVPPDENGTYLRVHVDLQDDFSMDQTLSLYLLETIPALDAAAFTYPLDLITLAESILENPAAVLRKQLDKLKAQKVAELKQDGVEYDQRMEELEKLEHPKPLRDFIYSTFNAFAAKHPWVGQENIKPKSIVREMLETFRSFPDYVREYSLQKSEGILLRHVSSVYKVLAQTVPDTAKTEPVREIEQYLRTMLRAVDSSLLEEWERLHDPGYERPVRLEELKPLQPDAVDVTEDQQAFLALIRQKIFQFLQCFARHDYAAALAVLLDPSGPEGQPWTPQQLHERHQAYLLEHESLSLDPEARNKRHTYLANQSKDAWHIDQILVDPRGLNDWTAVFQVDLPVSRETQEAALRLIRIGPVAAH